MFSKSLTAAVLVLSTAFTAIPASAQQISFGLSGGNQQERDLITGGLALFQIANGADPLEVLGNASRGSVGVVHQDGNGHNASLNQRGPAAGGIFQYGNNTNAHVVQNRGAADVVFVFGW